MNIRRFRYTDLAALIGIAEQSFAEEYAARGETSDSFAKQIRMVTRARMIPFRLLMSLTGIQWEMFVAEVEGNVIGCGGYLGRKQMELSNLMVHPDYRRRGIGHALLEKRLQHLTEKGYPFVTTTILASNKASLGNVNKQGFEIFDRYSFWETTLPVQENRKDREDDLFSRPVKPSDTAVFKELEEQIVAPLWLQIQGSAVPNYFLSFGERLMNQFMNNYRWIQAFSQEGQIIGFLLANTSASQTKGTLARPVIAESYLELLPAMLSEAADWLGQLGKTSIQMAVPDERLLLTENLQKRGWVKTQSWLRLVKWLDD